MYRWAQAQLAFEAALALNPLSAQSYFLLAMTLRSGGLDLVGDRTRAHLLRAIQIDPNHQQSLTWLRHISAD